MTASDLLMTLVEHEYDAVYITEHDAVWPEEDLAYLRRKFPWMRIFGGVERSIGSGHLLVLGTSDPEYLKIEDAQTLLVKARAEGHLTVLAHPFRWENADKILRDGLAMREADRLLPDAIEWRTPNHDEKCGRESRAFFAEHHTPLVNSGDVHAEVMIDKFWVETNEDLIEADDIWRIVTSGAYYNRARP